MSPQLQDTLGMFAFLAVELSTLFIGISLLVGMLQRHIPPSKVEALLSASRRRSYFLAAGLGAITPFCSCSTIPMLKGLIRARAGFGPMMVFLFASPLLNPIVVGLLIATFGLTLTAIYVVAAFGVSLGAGWLLQTLGFERYIRSDTGKESVGCGSSDCSAEPAAYTGDGSCCGSTPTTTSSGGCCGSTPTTTSSGGCCGSTPATTSNGCCGDSPSAAVAIGKEGKYSGLWREAWSDFVDVLPYLLIGIFIGSVIYGFMPTGLLEEYAGPDNPFAIPIAAVIGVPLYIRASAVIPLAAALMTKGVGAGAVLALIIGSAGASLTELILLRSLFKFRLLVAFVTVVFAMAIIAGYATFLFF
ncbi:permease [Microbulbifer thermotolerans]|uniref:permease n=1 Tax=Microbulbifer thermotolerans TaxID=252514 RepID=UPI002248C30E|nr:permease [Microbulbifer thermotolerans]MCX2794095.1 permease [Microbulbifer thermotolerans]MCX2840992.1 permease [Microbulbifer thermotolerans]